MRHIIDAPAIQAAVPHAAGSTQGHELPMDPCVQEPAQTEHADGRISCALCPHHCRLRVGETGRCRARAHIDGAIQSLNYGRFTAIALDPIEKKPLSHFHPGSFILSVGSFGCNLACPFCQNAAIAMADACTKTEDIAPTRLAALAKELSCRPPGNIGIAFTYNEPLLSFDYILDTAPLMHAAGLKVVLVTNGTICPRPRARLLPHIDAMNIDLKGWQEAFYRRLGGDLETVKETIAHAVSCGVHVEVTTLIIPGQNDSAADMDAEARWLSALSPDIPLHISRYFPCHNETAPPTPIASIDRLTAIARRHLKYVHRGNC